MILHALAAAAKGWYVFPLIKNEKKPLIKDNLAKASIDDKQIRQWWEQWPEANVGIATGPSGLVVIDIDVEKPNAKTATSSELFGIEAWESLVGNSIGFDKPEPRTYEVWTPSGGEHLYWQAPPAMTIKTGTSKLANGIDVRATGGSIVAAGSKTEKGEYVVHNHKNPQPMPSWLRSALRRAGLVETPVERGAVQTIIDSKTVSNGDRYADVTFTKVIDELKGTPIGAGQRNSALFRATARLNDFVTKGTLDAAAVADALYATATEVLNMNAKEAESTIRSGLGL